MRRIIRGYRKRGRLTNQLLAETVYATIHVMRDPKGKTVAGMFPQIFEDDDDYDDEPPITEEDAAELRELMTRINAQSETQP